MQIPERAGGSPSLTVLVIRPLHVYTEQHVIRSQSSFRTVAKKPLKILRSALVTFPEHDLATKRKKVGYL